MNKKLSILSLLFGLFVCVTLFSACGGDDDDDNGSSSNPIVGTWWVEKESKGQLKYTEMTFEKDMTFTWREYIKDSSGNLTLNISDSGTYYTSEGVLYTTWKKQSTQSRKKYTISGNKMTTDEAGGTTWTKK